MKLRDLLEQLTVELNMPKPEDAYDFDNIEVKDMGYGNYYKYIYTNTKGDKMEVTNLVSPPTVSLSAGVKKQPGKAIYIAFGLYEEDNEDGYNDDESEERKYKAMTGAGDMIKVLATVVEATKQTIEKEGGEDKIYAIKFAPSDIKRKNIYDHYITSLFPNFKKDLNSSSAAFTTFINKNFKDKSLDEIGGESEKMKPYPYKTDEDSEDFRSYSFTTDSGLKYKVDLEEDQNDEYGIVLFIDFGVVDDEDITGGSNQNVVTNRGEQYRIMNTLADIVKRDLQFNSYIKYIAFDASKRKLPNPISGKERDLDISSNARAKLYIKYIMGRLPNAKVVEDPNYGVLIKIK